MGVLSVGLCCRLKHKNNIALRKAPFLPRPIPGKLGPIKLKVPPDQAHQGDRTRGHWRRLDLVSACSVTTPRSIDLLALDEALSKLAAIEPAKADLVKLRFFAGLTLAEAAAALNISLATAERYWTFARSWLYAELAEEPDPPPD